MPRVRNSAVGFSPTKMPLNDDVAEKAKRLEKRKIQQQKQLNELKAAATPARKRQSLAQNGSPMDDVTPVKRVPILANFEEWMKMATDNKINAANSWNFALIDYFHDMSLLKEGDGVNFQKASCTLDGCVKIYTSRVDSVATETTKLLSGLADSSSKKSKGNEAADDDGDNDAEEEEGGKKSRKKRTARSAEATLVNSFDQLRVKKMELEFAVDPLFKKAVADFDEGGAKGLLMNHLSIDATGRIAFDSSDDPSADDEEKVPEEEESEDGPVDMAGLGAKFFPALDLLDSQDICPSLKTFELGSSDASLDLPFLKAPENWRDDQPDPTVAGADDDNDAGPMFGDDIDDDDGGGWAPDAGFGEGGEAWARETALVPGVNPENMVVGEEDGELDVNAPSYGVTLQRRENDEKNIFQYFDMALNNQSSKNWAGPEHWKVARIKEAQRAEPKKRKEKEPFEIDFFSPMSQELANQLYTMAPNNSNISLPRNQWQSKNRNLLPDDKHFNSQNLLRLFLKPKAIIGPRKVVPEGDVDESYWAGQQPVAPAANTDDDDHNDVQGAYDANFFQDDPLPMAGVDDDDDDGVFADARDHFSPDADMADAGGGAEPTAVGIDAIVAGDNNAAFGAQLVMQSRRIRPEYVQYARVAKKVDVRKLKENIWAGIAFDKSSEADAEPPRRFTDVMQNLTSVYPAKQMADISTSYGFICLLHLANEKGLILENTQGLTDIVIRKDPDAYGHVDGAE
ncbi:barren [Piedraia hortae CBS 480.64]|uniref:Condensin complex subunit 2 n=1 Tax=Piedraia hortae CBS 480.64 TaxID=1314780 RepID=A0A6A7BR16_9PEZI|nr:barren [Piedraia hortae CBS 480.64]